MTVKQHKYFPRQLTFAKETSTLDVVFMHDKVEDFTSTSIHTIWSKTATGKVFPRVVECQKQHTFGDIRTSTECVLCNAEAHTKMYTKYYPNQARSYAWVIDKTSEAGSRLKWIELPYSLEKAIKEQLQFYPGVPLNQLPFKLVKTVEVADNGSKRTSYAAGIVGGALAPYDMLAYAREHGMENGFTPLVGPRGIAPIEQVTDVNELAKLSTEIVDNFNEFAARQGYTQVPPLGGVATPTNPTAVTPPTQVANPITQPQVVPQPTPQVAPSVTTTNPPLQTPPLGTAPTGMAQTQPIETANEQPVTQPLQGANPFPQQGEVFQTNAPEGDIPKLDITNDDLPF